MSTLASIGTLYTVMEPGREASVDVTVTNDGDTVEAYTLEVLGELAPYAEVLPPEVSVYPGAEETVRVSFVAPLVGGPLAGEVPFAVRVVPHQHPEDGVVPEGIVRVAARRDLTVELLPRTVGGRFGARYHVAVDNRGNAPVLLTADVSDPAGVLGHRMAPGELEVVPSTARFARLAVRPPRWVWTGPALTHPFVVVLHDEAADPVRLDGTYVQQPVLPAGLGRLALAAAAVVIGLVALWFGLVRPTVHSAAADAVAKPLQQLQTATAQNEQAAKAANTAASGAASQAQKAATTASNAQQDAQTVASKVGVTLPDHGGAVLPVTGGSVPTSIARSVTVAPGKTGSTDPYVVAAAKSLQITDIVLQNPQGDVGELQLRRGTETLLTVSLANFRDLDYHFVTPILVAAGQQVTVQVHCDQPGTPAGRTAPAASCQASALLGSELVG